MKFTIGKLGLELLFSWNPSPDNTPVLSIAPVNNTSPTKPPVLPSTGHVTDIRQVVYVITSAFEGGPVGKINYGNLSGNFDGQGYSIGFLQWCVGQGSDVKLFTRLESRYPGVLKSCLGSNLYAEFMQYLNKPLSERLHWAQRSVNTSANRIEENWKHAFSSLCATKEFQECQNFYAEDVFQHAVDMCKEYGLKTNRALMLMFDICTQNGSIKASTKATILAAKAAKEKVLGRVLREKEYLELIAIKRAESSNPQWVADVKSRKLCIVYGAGTVHGDKYDLDKLGLDDGPIVL